MPIKNPEERREYMREYFRRYRIANRRKITEADRERIQKRTAERRKKKLCLLCGKKPERGMKCDRCRATAKRHIQKLKSTVVEKYGGKCACCGEKEIAFLTIDHVDGGGNRHRRELKLSMIYRWLIRNGYPSGFQILCWNCNLAKHHFGECPHKLRPVQPVAPS